MYRIPALALVAGLFFAALLPIAAVAAPPIERFGGNDRFDVATAISATWAPGVPVVYVVKATDYPDALSAAPVAAKDGGPLLLTLPASLPPKTRAEITRLSPVRIVVVGGLASVSQSVQNELNTIAPTTRIAGTDRFAASRNLVSEAFLESGVSRLYLATGRNFPDALAASAAAGSLGSAVLLVDGTASRLDQPTLDLIRELGTREVVIAGGTNSVSIGIEQQVQMLGLVDGTQRLSGPDRYSAALAISQEAFPAASQAYIATGSNFPDALTGAVLAGSRDAPLLLTQSHCVTPAVGDYIDSLGATSLGVFGGTNSVSDAAAALEDCRPYQNPTVSPSYSCSTGLAYAIQNLNQLPVTVVVGADFNIDGNPEATIQAVTIAAGQSYTNYAAVQLPDRRTTNIVYQVGGVTFRSDLQNVNCRTQNPVASPSYTCGLGLAYALQNPNPVAATVVVGADFNSDGAPEATIQTVTLSAGQSYTNYSAAQLPEDRTTNVVFQIDGGTFLSKTFAVNCQADSPSPAQQWANARFGSFPGTSISGFGASVVTLPAGARAGILTAQHSGLGYFGIVALDAANEFNDLLVNEVGQYRGSVSWGVKYEDASSRALEIDASGAWTIELQPVGNAPAFGTGGSTSGVFLYGGGPTRLTYYHPGSGYFGIWETRDGSFGLDTDLLVNDIGTVGGTVTIRSGYSVIDVESDGSWGASLG